MNTQKAWACEKCQQRNVQDARFCTQCGAAFTSINRRGSIIALGLTAVPFIITPIILALDSGGGMYFEELFYLLANTFLMGIYLAVGAIVSAVMWLWRKDRSVASGVLAGLGVGMVLGVASCAASLATIS